MTLLPYRRNWPGLTSRPEYVYVDHQDLATVEAGLLREEARLGKLVASRETILAVCAQEPFGAWYTAQYLTWLNQAVCSIFIDGIHATRYNLLEFGGRLGLVSRNYRAAEDAIVRMLNSRRGRVNGWEINMRSPGSNWSRTDRAYDTPPRPYPRLAINPAHSVRGNLRVPAAPLHWEFVEAYPARQLAEWLNPLKAGRIRDAQVAGAGHISVMTQTLEELRVFLYRQAQVLERGWSDRASPLAQAKLQRIDATIGSSVGFGEEAAALQRRLSVLLEDALAGTRSRDLSSGRFPAHELVLLFRVIHENYRDAIERYPRSWAFDLPFGGIESADPEPSAPQLPPPGPPPAPGTGATPVVRPVHRDPPLPSRGPFVSPGDEDTGAVPPVLG
ncbi:hypothetical protein [Actinomadura bangladeshensis]|uniref:Uncharacterized protein n=1 Tax=Actinomadura bangladeshensis TaxID=453573 RepID=A0A6L9QHE6_9ACTN|nr:hypothetical protein [Actinomadura bangladeshensis]NEA24857.1 hypothetical protein [Actinomadura bangladeshensis]